MILKTLINFILNKRNLNCKFKTFKKIKHKIKKWYKGLYKEANKGALIIKIIAQTSQMKFKNLDKIKTRINKVKKKIACN